MVCQCTFDENTNVTKLAFCQQKVDFFQKNRTAAAIFEHTVTDYLSASDTLSHLNLDGDMHAHTCITLTLK